MGLISRVSSRTYRDLMAAARRVQANRKPRREDPRFLSVISILSAGEININSSTSAAQKYKYGAYGLHRMTMIRESQLPTETVEYLGECFNKLDINSTGEIDAFQLKIAIDALGIIDSVSVDEVQNLVREANASNNSNTIGFNEFISIISHLYIEDDTPLQCENEWSEVFNELDVDGDGVISHEDLKESLVQLRLKFTESDVFEMIQSNVTQSHAGVTLDEFL